MLVSGFLTAELPESCGMERIILLRSQWQVCWMSAIWVGARDVVLVSLGGVLCDASTSILSSNLCVQSCFSHVQLFVTLWTALSARFFCPWGCPGRNTGVGCHALLQGIFPTQGSNACFFCFLHWEGGPLPLSTTWLTPVYKDHYKEILELWAGVEKLSSSSSLF